MKCQLLRNFSTWLIFNAPNTVNNTSTGLWEWQYFAEHKVNLYNDSEKFSDDISFSSPWTWMIVLAR